MKPILILSTLLLSGATFPVTGRGYAGTIVFSGQVIQSASFQASATQSPSGAVILSWSVNLPGPGGMVASGRKMVFPGEMRIYDSGGVRLAVTYPPVRDYSIALARMKL